MKTKVDDAIVRQQMISMMIALKDQKPSINFAQIHREVLKIFDFADDNIAKVRRILKQVEEE